MFENLNADWLLPLIVLFPLAGALANGLGGRTTSRRLVGLVGVGSVLLSFGAAVMLFIKLYGMKHAGNHDARLEADLWEWFSISVPNLGGGYRSVPIEIRFVFDSLSGLMTLVVTGIGSLIHIYSIGYMDEEKSYARFFTYLNLFMASMLVLVLASSFPVLFVGWEGVGLCSYLLIGFWYENKSYAAAGRKAFIVNRIGDFGVLVGMFILVSIAGSFEFDAINAAAPEMTGPFAMGGVVLGMTATVAGLFLFLGCTGKSAQIPLFVWLPDAMAGPTPVSALIHAATMVTAGVYLTCRLSPVFLESPVAMSVIAVTGALTAFVAATVAVVQKEMKRILAYSTVSQLGFMFAAVGVGAFSGAFFHVFTHAFFKACLFLGAGSVMHAVHAHGDANIFKLGGLRKIMPITHATFLVSCLAIAGFPGLSGFFSKDELLLGAAEVALHGNVESGIHPAVGWFVLVTLVIAATMTAFYMMRLYFFTFSGTYRSAAPAHDEHDDAHDDEHGYSPTPHENPWTITLPLTVLAIGATFGGLLGLPHLLPAEYVWWGHWMEPSISNLTFGAADHAVVDHTAAYMAMGLGTMAALIGIGGAYVLYNNKAEDTFTTKLPKKLYDFLMDKWRFDELYDVTLIKPLHAVASFEARTDKSFIDGLMTGLASKGVMALSWLSTRIQVGVVHAYGTAMVAGLAFVTWWFVYPHATVNVDVDGANATFVASRGLGYEYRWDLDSDGNYDVPLQASTVEIELTEDASDTAIRSLVSAVRTAVAPVELLPLNRSALGHHHDGHHYTMHPPASVIDDVRIALDASDIVTHYNISNDIGAEAIRATETTASFHYHSDDIKGYRAFFGVLRGEPLELTLGERAILLGDAELGRDWLIDEEENDVPPSITVENGEVWIRPNGASVRFDGAAQTEPFVAEAGDTVVFGRVPMRIAALVEATLEVKNSFGNLDHQTIEFVIDDLNAAPVILHGATALNVGHQADNPTDDSVTEVGQ